MRQASSSKLGINEWVKYLVNVDAHDPDAAEEAKGSQSRQSLEKTGPQLDIESTNHRSKT